MSVLVKVAREYAVRADEIVTLPSHDDLMFCIGDAVTIDYDGFLRRETQGRAAFGFVVGLVGVLPVDRCWREQYEHELERRRVVET